MAINDDLVKLWLKEFSPKGACCLCGNHGRIDTRNVIFTPAGVECGAEVFCICPNGRALKQLHSKEELRVWTYEERLND